MTGKAPLFVIAAGEPSGDLLAAEIIRAIQKIIPNARFVGITGVHMQAAGCESLAPIDDLSVLLTEAVKNLRRILAIRRTLIQFCYDNQPAAYIGVDAPAFNLKIEKKLKQQGIQTIHYNSPKIWAWRYSRIHDIAKSCSLMLTQFPFEKEIYDEKNIPAQYVGHPLADMLPMQSDKNGAREQLGLPKAAKILALLPGSRKQELAYLAESFLLTAEQLHQTISGGIVCVIPMVNQKRVLQLKQLITQLTLSVPIHIVEGQAQTVMAASDAILLAAGTATLEAMLIKKPMVVAYRIHPITFHLLKWFVRVDYFSLPNIIARQALVPEFLQSDVNVENLTNALLPYLSTPEKIYKHHAIFTELHRKLKNEAANKTALAIYSLCCKQESV